MFLDANILIYVSNPVLAGHQTATDLLIRVSTERQLRINDIVFSELSPGFSSPEALTQWLDRLNIQRERSGDSALFRACAVHLEYRRAGGAKTSPLPDFFIGADAVTAGVPLLTNDRTRYATNFPDLELIAP